MESNAFLHSWRSTNSTPSKLYAAHKDHTLKTTAIENRKNAFSFLTSHSPHNYPVLQHKYLHQPKLLVSSKASCRKKEIGKPEMVSFQSASQNFGGQQHNMISAIFIPFKTKHSCLAATCSQG